MKTIFDIAKAELKQLFFSPIAWLVIILFTIQVSDKFTSTFYSFARQVALGNPSSGNITVNLFTSIFGGVFPMILGILALYLPLLTMGIMSKEMNSGTIKFLYCSPIRNSQIIAGKFISIMLFGLVLLGIIALFIGFAAINVKDLDIPLLMSGMLGFFLLICTYAAVGIFMSSLTSYQVVAVILTITLLGSLNMLSGLWQDIDFVRDITWWLSIKGRTREFMSGLICSEDVIYFVMLTLFFLYLTVVRLRSIREGFSKKATLGRYMLGFLVLVCVGYISSRPVLMCFYDTTHTKTNTLTAESQRVINSIDGDLKLTLYVNALDGGFYQAFPTQVNSHIDRFRRFTRLKPEMDYEFVYYYDKSQMFSGTEQQMRAKMVDLCRISKLDTAIFLNPQQIKEKIDLSEENNKVTVVFERGNGDKVMVRTFNDEEFFPSEAEITAGLRGFIEKIPSIAFIKGNGEREITSVGDAGMYHYAYWKEYRNAILNQGFNVCEATLDCEIASEIDIVVIADMRVPLNEIQKANLDKYIARGGNLMLMGEVNRQNITNPIIEQFGAKFMDGELVKKQIYLPNLMLARATTESELLSDYFSFLTVEGAVVTMPGVVGIDYSSNGVYQAVPMLVSENDVWNELEAKDLNEDSVSYNPLAGEVQKQYIMALALHRKVGDKEQKIILSGDVDSFCNSELQRNRKDVPAFNFNFINGAFNWLSDNRSPVNMARPELRDNAIHYDRAYAKGAKLFFVWLLPIGILLFALVIWVRRRGR